MKKLNQELLNKIQKREGKPTLKEVLYRNRGKVEICKDYKPSVSRTIKIKGKRTKKVC